MIQSKTGKPVRFEITDTTRLSLEGWKRSRLDRPRGSVAQPDPRQPRLSTRHCAGLSGAGSFPLAWNQAPSAQIRCENQAGQIHKMTGNMRAGQRVQGHTNMDSTVRDLGADIKDAPSLSEGIDLQTPPRSKQPAQIGPELTVRRFWASQRGFTKPVVHAQPSETGWRLPLPNPSRTRRGFSLRIGR